MPLKLDTTLILKPRRLLQNYDGWGPVADDLRRRTRPINVLAQIREMTRQLGRIDEMVLQFMAPRIIDARDRLLAVLPSNYRTRPYALVNLAKLRRAARRKAGQDKPYALELVPMPGHVVAQIRRWRRAPAI